MPPPYFRLDNKRHHFISAYTSCLSFVSRDRWVCFRASFVWSHLQVLGASAVHVLKANPLKKILKKFQNLTISAAGHDSIEFARRHLGSVITWL